MHKVNDYMHKVNDYMHKVNDCIISFKIITLHLSLIMDIMRNTLILININIM